MQIVVAANSAARAMLQLAGVKRGRPDIMTILNDYAPLLLRICLVMLFPFSALDKIVNWRAAMQQAGSLPFKPAMLVASILVETVAPVCIITGWHDHFAAFVLAGFCVVTALLFHQFWRFAGFWRFREGEGLEHFWEFLKNFGLVGGLGLIVLAPRTLPLGTVLQDPLASSHVIGPEAGAPLTAPTPAVVR
jgi:putative oxidoreductase